MTVVGVVGLAVWLGAVYPWPWIRDAETTVEKTAQVRRLAGPEGCICLAIAVDTVWEPKSVYGGHADAFCVPESDARMKGWLDAGTVSGRWKLTFRTTWFTETTLHSTDLLSVETVPAIELFANSGCTMAVP